MLIISKVKNYLSKSKIGKYFVIGGFAFFLIKGIIWLVIIVGAFFGIGKI